MFRSLLLLTAAFITSSVCLAQNTTPPTTEQLQALTTQEDYSLPWPAIQQSDILWQKRVWRNIDISATANQPMFAVAHLLATGAHANAFKLYENADGRIAAPLSGSELDNTLENLTAEKVTGYAIKEDWLYLKSQHKIVVRILGIAPVAAVSGTAEAQPLFWLYYPDARQYLAAKSIEGANESWDQFFESRTFSSSISRVSDFVVAK